MRVRIENFHEQKKDKIKSAIGRISPPALLAIKQIFCFVHFNCMNLTLPHIEFKVDSTWQSNRHGHMSNQITLQHILVFPNFVVFFFTRSISTFSLPNFLTQLFQSNLINIEFAVYRYRCWLFSWWFSQQVLPILVAISRLLVEQKRLNIPHGKC